ncbi:hypothetical protein SCLCIDRAFT_1181819, partial [Scleroderma citrinum Foug A]
ALPVLKVSSLCALSSAMSHRMCQKLLQEVHVWSKLDHKNVIKLLGVTTAFDHTISIVSPLMSWNVYDYVQDPDVDPRSLVCCMCILGIANGLHYLHMHQEGRIIHGDIKGHNVLVSNNGHVLLGNFGFSRFAEESFHPAVKQLSGGTLNWMAPEYFAMEKFKMTAPGDVWAFGMTALV